MPPFLFSITEQNYMKQLCYFSLFLILLKPMSVLSMDFHKNDCPLTSKITAEALSFSGILLHPTTNSLAQHTIGTPSQDVSIHPYSNPMLIPKLPSLRSLNLPTMGNSLAKPPVELSHPPRSDSEYQPAITPTHTTSKRNTRVPNHGQPAPTIKKARRIRKPKIPNSCVFSQHDPLARTIFRKPN